jgi:predicted DNA-binding protein (UPF0251 family)
MVGQDDTTVIAAIRERLASAWDDVTVERRPGSEWGVYCPNASVDLTHLATVYWTDFADAIAHAPTDIAALLAIVERQREQLAEAEGRERSMREALKEPHDLTIWGPGGHNVVRIERVLTQIDRALLPSAGRAHADEVRRLREALATVRVTVQCYVPQGYARKEAFRVIDAALAQPKEMGGMTDLQRHTWQRFVTQARTRIERMKARGFVVSEDDTDVAILAVNTELTTLREKASGHMGYHDVEQFYKDEPDDPGEGT